MELDDILVIDDSKVQRQHALELCRALGAASVREAADGGQGLAMMRERLPSLVLLDLEMPGMDGVRVMQGMAASGLHTPVVVASSKDYLLISTVEMMGRELGLPVLGALQKPLRLDALRDLAQRAWTPDARMDGREFAPAELRAALDADQIRPSYQPKVDLADGALKGAEVLASWRHPQLGAIGADSFLPVIEQSGWATELTMQMLTQGLGQWREWARQGLRLPLSLNLEPRSLQEDGLVEQIERIIADSHVPVRFISFEVTETAIADNLSRAIGCAVRLRMAGVGLAVDNFGTGFAAMQQLERFPFTELKIDPSLVTSIGGKPHLQAVLNSIVELARRLKLATVAEGVQSQEDCQLMAERGCQLGQGRYFAEALPPDELLAWSRARTAAASK
ncbi:EAL domain-containing response regulator [Chromobacterium subtsugae]|uniref:EAL domain-containing response regulator n=1 Tax=Chromobacterium subtsugae TaxID=251747 RepID=UPI000640D7EE|nr:EAL domain-containing response regulator [Chromobacterium subtsugae]